MSKGDRYTEFFMTERLSKTQRRELAQYFVPDTFEPMVFSKNCAICNHILKPQIEEMLYHKVPFKTINSYLYVLGYPKLMPAGYKNHLKEHCAIAKASTQVSMANYLARVSEDVTARLSGEGVLDAMLIDYVENHDGQEDPMTNKDAISAVKVKHSMTQGKDDRRMFVELYERMEAAKALATESSLCIEGEVVIDAELVEEESDMAEGDFEDFL
jgi:hypothetical protein